MNSLAQGHTARKQPSFILIPQTASPATPRPNPLPHTPRPLPKPAEGRRCWLEPSRRPISVSNLIGTFVSAGLRPARPSGTAPLPGQDLLKITSSSTLFLPPTPFLILKERERGKPQP